MNCLAYVFVASGTYEMPDATTEINDPILLVGEDGPETTILQATGEEHRLLSASSPNFLMSGFTVTGGKASDNLGGALRLVAGTVTNCIFYGNKSSAGGRGGAVFLGSADALLTCSVVTNNSVSGSGGGVYALDGRIERCYFEGNTASGSGGGVYLADGQVVQCTFENNTSSIAGGGVAGSSSTVGVVSNCVFRNCRAGSSGFTCTGGGASNLAVVRDCTVENCSAGRGGGLADIATVSHCLIRGCTNLDPATGYIFLGGGGYYSENAVTSMDNTLLAENESVSGGGAIASKPSVRLRNVTIAGNRGRIPAVSLHNGDAYLSAVNSIIAYNSDLSSVTNGVSCTNAAGRAFSGLDHSCVFDDSYTNVAAKATVVGSIQKDPLFNLEMHKDLPYWSLRGVSPCKNAGAKLDYAADDVDLAGNPRINGSKPDMGCYECALGGMSIFVR